MRREPSWHCRRPEPRWGRPRGTLPQEQSAEAARMSSLCSACRLQELGSWRRFLLSEAGSVLRESAGEERSQAGVSEGIGPSTGSGHGALGPACCIAPPCFRRGARSPPTRWRAGEAGRCPCWARLRGAPSRALRKKGEPAQCDPALVCRH